MTAIRLVLEKVWRGTSLTGDDVVVLVLLLAMAASVVHLLTMLITRWGDRNIAFKALIGSLLVHGVCLLGLEVFDPLQPDYVRASQEMFEPVEVVTEVLVESDDQVPLSESGNTAAPDQPSQPQIDLERLPVPARKMEVTEDTEREQENLDSLQTSLPDVTQFAENQEPELANPVDAGMVGPREVAADDPGAEIDTFHKRNATDVFVAESERTVTKPGEVEPKRRLVERESAAGQTEKIDTRVKFDTSAVDLATSDASAGVAVRLPEPDEAIERRSSPVPGSEPVELASTETSIRPKRTLPARAFESRLPRPERARPSSNDDARPARVPSEAPRTPIPLSSAYEDVRVGLRAPADSDSLRSAADLVELNANRIQRRDRQPEAYRLRSREYRQEAVWKFGGTERSEATVERSLRWLSSQQLPDGRWNADAYGAGLVEVDELGVKRNFAGRDADTGLSALVTLAFLGAGYTHEDGRYAVQVDRALDWLISQQGEDGNLAGDARRYARMYCHAMATYALAEALAMQNEMVMDPIVDPDLLALGPSAAASIATMSGMAAGLPDAVYGTTWSMSVAATLDAQAWTLRRVNDLRLRSALLKAVRFTIRQQSSGGGWRYAKGQVGDVSMFGWHLMSLKSSELAGVRIPQAVRDRMFQFINSVRQGEHGGLFGYRYDEEVTPVMTAEALFCQQMLGFKRDTSRNVESVRYLLKNLPRLSQLNLYYWYYGTLAMYQYGGKPWEQWNAAVRDTLIEAQVREGSLVGSWDPNGPWGRYGGRLYSTALATLTLEVYYRLLPLYRMNDPE